MCRTLRSQRFSTWTSSRNSPTVAGRPAGASRRAALRVLAGCAALLLTGHSPYGQWSVFRRSRLIVFACADDEAAQRLARRVGEFLAKEVPASNATWARAPNALEVARLLGSHQADFALLRPRDARDARIGDGPYRANGALALTAIAAPEGYVLVALDELPTEYAYELARAMANFGPRERDRGFDRTRLARDVPWHPGAAAVLEGRPPPATPGRD